MIVKIAVNAKIEANVKIAGLDKIGEIVPIATEVLDRKEKKIKNNMYTPQWQIIWQSLRRPQNLST